MEAIIQSIQRQLTRKVPRLRYIDRDWGQLLTENPPVKWPCALIDVQSVEYQNVKRGEQHATATFVITVCNSRTVPTSSRSTRKDDAYLIFELIREIHYALQMFTNEGNFSPLMRVSLEKNIVDAGNESYNIYYRASFGIPYDGQNA